MADASHMPTDHPVLARIVEFTRLVRANGFQVGIQEGLDAPRIAAWCGVLDLDGFRWGLRTLLCGRRSEWLRYDELFDAYWHGAVSGGHSSFKNSSQAGSPAPDSQLESLGAAEGTGAEAEGISDGSGRPGGASYRESTERADFRHFTDPTQLRRLEDLVERLARRMLRRVARRRRLARRGTRLSLRHTLRKSLRYGGTPFELVHRSRDLRLPRLLVLLDVSGSMNLYSMLFLRFASALVQAFREIEVFIFHTHLARVTEALRQRDDRRRAESLALISAGWSGGTRIGVALEDFLSRFSEHLRGRRTIAVIISDGLDTGQPGQLSAALGKLRQRVRRILWLNPLKGRPGYEPAAAGMQAALPHVDVFAPAHNLESLAALETYLAAL
jgi:uncharacterized protein with von Willebrand factor type A (vWA) domain